MNKIEREIIKSVCICIGTVQHLKFSSQVLYDYPQTQQVEEITFTPMLTWCLLVMFVASKAEIGNGCVNFYILKGYFFFVICCWKELQTKTSAIRIVLVSMQLLTAFVSKHFWLNFKKLIASMTLIVLYFC